MKVVIRELLKEKVMHMKQLAIKSGLNYKNLVLFCNNKTKQVQLENIEKICKTLECTPNDIFEIE